MVGDRAPGALRMRLIILGSALRARTLAAIAVARERLRARRLRRHRNLAFPPPTSRSAKRRCRCSGARAWTRPRRCSCASSRKSPSSKSGRRATTAASITSRPTRSAIGRGTSDRRPTLGDKQAPEGFYRVSNTQMNPNSNYYLAFNLGYPNAYDRAWQRTGDALMVHGKCKSVGCYAMTDALIEEIYTLARESLKGGQESFEVHAFPFRMTEANMARYQGNHERAVLEDAEAGLRLLREVSPAAHRRRVREALRRQRRRCRPTPRSRPTAAARASSARCSSRSRPSPTSSRSPRSASSAPGPKTRQFANMTPAPSPDGTPTQAAYGPSYGLGAPIETGSTGASSLGFAQ